jgi:hypothetical protein
MDIDKMSKDELENLQVIKEQEYQLAIQSLCSVEIRDNELATEVAKIQLDRKSLANAIIQAKSNLRRCSSELRNLKTMLFKRIGGM